MSIKKRKVLIIGSLEISRVPAMAIAKKLSENGYGAVFCHIGSDEFNIEEDRILEDKTSLTDIIGLVVLDDGGAPEYATKLVKEADKKDIVIALYQTGCAIGKDAKIFKDKYLCSGLPEKYYKGNKPTEAACVRSGNLITCAGGNLNGFASLIVSALGGKKKTIVMSGPECPEVAKTANNILKNLSVLFDFGKDFTEKEVDGICQLGSRHLAIFPDKHRKILGRGNYCIILGENTHLIIKKKDLSSFLMNSKLSAYTKEPEECDFEISVCVEKRNNCWQTKSINAFKGDQPINLRTSILKLGEKSKNIIDECSEKTHQACLLVEAFLERPDEFKTFQTYFSLIDDTVKLTKFSSSSLLPIEVEENKDVQSRGKLIKEKILEREMAQEEMFIQPDGSIVLILGDETKRFPVEEAASFINKLAIKENEEAIRQSRSFSFPQKNLEYRRLLILAARLRHKLRILITYLTLKQQIKTAEVDIEGVNGWYSNLDLPTKERVYEYSELEQDLWNDDQWIKNQTRYHPEYYKTDDSKTSSGFYYTWWEIANEPYYWSRILEDGIYPMVMDYKGVGR